MLEGLKASVVFKNPKGLYAYLHELGGIKQILYTNDINLAHRFPIGTHKFDINLLGTALLSTIEHEIQLLIPVVVEHTSL